MVTRHETACRAMQLDKRTCGATILRMGFDVSLFGMDLIHHRRFFVHLYWPLIVPSGERSSAIGLSCLPTLVSLPRPETCLIFTPVVYHRPLSADLSAPNGLQQHLHNVAP